ncbi:YqaA family protein [Paenibacillus oceani]|uniref:VTT domain-containing protein n=1 Tax=Paenibacillus oceani TaxID=2772510 RepID=A0A927H1I7_9BACL|nr:VTT domain-containing protein [Paenibacillus oceani]MBD2865201.1 VTT domain-containing protein [Paenibacillus oceani]
MLHGITEFLSTFGIWGMFIHSFIDAIIFPIPAFFLQVSLSILNPSSALWLATVGYIACLLGTPIGYLIGRLLGKSVLTKLVKKEWVEKATVMFKKNGEAAILIGSFTPIPFKVFTILSGALHFSIWRLLAFAAIGRAAKFYIVGVLFYYYGKAAEQLINSYLTYVFLGIAVVLAIGWAWLKKRQKKKEQAVRQLSEESPVQASIAPIEQAAETPALEETVLADSQKDRIPKDQAVKKMTAPRKQVP